MAFFKDDEGNYVARLTGDNDELFVGNLQSMYVQPTQGRSYKWLFCIFIYLHRS